MGRYRKVDERIWSDRKFLELSDNAQLVFFFLLTHPMMTGFGALRAGPASLAEEKGWGRRRMDAALAELTASGMVECDSDARVVVIPNYLRYNMPENPNVVRGWSRVADWLPECQLRTRLYTRIAARLRSLGEAWIEALPKAFREGFSEASTKPSVKGCENPLTANRNRREDPPIVPPRGDIDRVWSTFRLARAVYCRQIGRDYVEPAFTGRVKRLIARGLVEHGLARTEAAGVGLHLDEWHTGKHRDNRQEYLEPWRAWSVTARRDNIERFSDLVVRTKLGRIEVCLPDVDNGDGMRELVWFREKRAAEIDQHPIVEAQA